METFFKRLKNNNTLSQETKRFSRGDYQNQDHTLKFVFSGVQKYRMNRKEFSVYPDCFLMINKNTNFESTIHSEEYVQSLSMSFDSDFIHDVSSCLTRSTDYLLSHPVADRETEPHFPETLLPLKSNLVFNLNHIKRYVDANLDDEQLLEEYLYHAFINYYEIFNKEVVLAEDRLDCLKTFTKKEVIKRVNLAKDFIYCNFNQPIALMDIAEYSCLSKSHLIRTFKQVIGETPYQFLTRVRLKRANHLLKTTRLPLQEIVPAVGLENASSFIRLYKSYFQCTPAKIKRLAN